MKPSEAAEIEAKKTYAAFIKYSKVDKNTGSQYNGEVYSPMNMGTK